MHQKWQVNRIGSGVVGILLGLGVTSLSQANPGGGEVVHGEVDFSSPSPGVLNITNSPGAIINWQQFGIDAGEVTRFIQQNADSAVLNRVTGGNPSELLGGLLSNGHVYLINPNGILAGGGAVIDTAGFVASTLNMTDEDFLAGNLKFEGDSDSGAIVNAGFIHATGDGNVVLVASSIENRGVIKTEGGQLILAAGESVTLRGLGLEDIEFDVQAPEHEVLNLGQLLTDGGAARIFAGSIQHSGSINADSLSVDAAGNIQLFAQSGIELAQGSELSADGVDGGVVSIQSVGGETVVLGDISARGHFGAGGEIEVLGEYVGLLGEASVDASGALGGGDVLIGGDYKGEGDTQTAQGTLVSENTAITADAIQEGDGGRVIVWADGSTLTYGDITARGGAQSGNGGFVETSGREYLDFSSAIDVSAANGELGSVLLDPATVEIMNGAGDGDGNQSQTNFVGQPLGGLGRVLSTDLSPTQIYESEIEGIIGGVTIEATGQITIRDLADNTLQLNAASATGGSAFAFRSTQSGGIAFEDPNDVLMVNGIGDVLLIAEGTGTLNIGSVSANNVLLSAAAGITQPMGTITANSLLLTAPQGTAAPGPIGSVDAPLVVASADLAVPMQLLIGQADDVQNVGSVYVDHIAGDINLVGRSAGVNSDLDLRSTGVLNLFPNAQVPPTIIANDVVLEGQGLTVNTPIVAAGDVTLSALSGTLTIDNAAVAAGGQDVLLMGGDLDISLAGIDLIRSAGRLTVQNSPGAPGITIGIQPVAGRFSIERDDELARLVAAQELIINNTSGAALDVRDPLGTIDINAPELRLVSASGININANTTLADKNLTLEGSGDKLLVAEAGNLNVTAADLTVRDGALRLRGGESSAGGSVTVTTQNIVLERAGLEITAGNSLSVASADVFASGAIDIDTNGQDVSIVGGGSDSSEAQLRAGSGGLAVNTGGGNLRQQGGAGQDATANLISDADINVNVGGGTIELLSGFGEGADAVMSAALGQGDVNLVAAVCTNCNLLEFDPFNATTSDQGIFARNLIRETVSGNGEPPPPGSDLDVSRSTSSVLSLLDEFERSRIVVGQDSLDEEDNQREVLVCR